VIVRLLLATILIGLTASCSGSKATDPLDEHSARDVAAAWFRAIANDDTLTACRLMASDLQQDLSGEAGTSTCSAAVTTLNGTLDEQTRNAMRGANFGIRTDLPDHVVITLNSPTWTYQVGVFRFGTDWLLNDIR
jgi:hypothetical protein